MSIISCSGTCEDAMTDGYGIKQGLDIQRWPSPSVVLASVTFHWPLNHVSKLLEQTCDSGVFTVGSFHWKLKFSAKGNQQGTPRHEEMCSSLYLENVECSSASTNGPLTSFSLGIINQDDPEKSLWRPCRHTFSEEVPDWGFHRMVLLEDLIHPDRGFVVNDVLILGIRF